VVADVNSDVALITILQSTPVATIWEGRDGKMQLNVPDSIHFTILFAIVLE
jgi:hypothetical protein